MNAKDKYKTLVNSIYGVRAVFEDSSKFVNKEEIKERKVINPEKNFISNNDEIIEVQQK